MFSKFDRFHWGVIALIGFYCLFYLVARISFLPVLTLDESEMLVLIQDATSALWGYQPPLYLSLQRGFVDLFGINRFAVFGLKYGLIFLTYLFVFLTSVLVFEDKRKILLVLCGYLLLKTFADTLHNLSHTVLLAFAVSLFLFTVVALQRRRTLFLYALLGLSIGVGVFSKYNFLVFFAAAVAASVFVKAFRPVFFDRRFLLSLVIALACVIPFAGFVEEAFRIFYLPRVASKGGEDYGYLYSFYDYLVSLINYALPFLLFVILLFPGTLRIKGAGEPLGPYRRYLGYVMLFAVVAMALQILVLGPMHFKSRWHICALFPLPLFVFAGALDLEKSAKRIRLFVAVACFMTVGRFAYVFVGYSFDICTECSYVFPIDNVVESLRERGFEKGVLISDSYNMLGRLKLSYPESYVFPGRAEAPGEWQGADCVVIARKHDGWRNDRLFSTVELSDPAKKLEEAASTTSIDFAYREPIPVVYFLGVLRQKSCVVE